MMDTFKAVLSSEEQGRLMKLLKWSDKLGGEEAGNFSLMVRGKQTQALNKMGTAMAGAGGAAGVAGGVLGSTATLGIAAGILLSPKFIAHWATSGGATDKALKTANGIIDRINAKNFDPIREGVALATFLGSAGLRVDDVPEELRIEGLAPEEMLIMRMMEEAQGSNNAPQQQQPQPTAQAPQAPQMPSEPPSANRGIFTQ